MPELDPQAAERQAAERLRTALLDQLAYLVDEVEALRAVVGRVPEELLEGRPFEGERTIKESFGLIAAADEQVHLPQLQRVAEGGEPTFEPLDEDALLRAEPWNEFGIDGLLQRIQRARGALLDALRALPPEAWAHTAVYGGRRLDLYRRLHGILQYNTDLLRGIGYRLHESHLTSRPQDLPK